MGAALGFAPQLLAWKAVYGSWLVYTYDAESFVHATSPRVLDVLLSSRHGLLTWSPIFAIALAGFPALVRRAGSLAWAFALWALLLLYVVASWEQWWLGHSFGHRGFLCLFPVLATSLALAWDRLETRAARVRMGVALVLATLWSGALMAAFLSEMIPYSGTFSWWDYVTSLPDLPGHVRSKVAGG